MSNSETEKKAIELIRKYLIESKRVNNESEISKAKKGSGYDLDLSPSKNRYPAIDKYRLDNQ